ncbi:MAG: hypothetical protein QXO37_09340 [Candidatus Nitrosocaldaceae archaeon]
MASVFKASLLLVLVLLFNITVINITNVGFTANAQVVDLVVTAPATTSGVALMSFVKDVYGILPYSVASNSTSFYMELRKIGCNPDGFNVSIPSLTETRYFLMTSAIYNDHIYIVLLNNSKTTYYYATINYSLNGCTFNISTTSPVWSSSPATSYVRHWDDRPIWVNERKYFIGYGIYDYNTKTYTSFSTRTDREISIPFRTQNELFVIATYQGTSGSTWYSYICRINITTYSSACNTLFSAINGEVLGVLLNNNNNKIFMQFRYTSGSNTLYSLVSYDLSTEAVTQQQTNKLNLFHTYGSSYVYTLSTTYKNVYIPLLNSDGSTSVIIYYDTTLFRYYRTQQDAINEFKAPVGDLSINPYHHILYANAGSIANLFDSNFNLILSTTIPSSVSTYNLIRFPTNVKYIQLLDTNTNQSIIYAKDELSNTANNLKYYTEPFLTTVVMTPISFARLDTDANYYYVEVTQNAILKNTTQYYAKFIDQSSQVTLALRQAQCSYLVLHEINKSTLQESTMNFMVCEDGISKTIEIPNTVNFVYAQDAIFKIHKTNNDDFSIGISSNRDINSEVKVTVCDVIDKAMYDFENSTDEGVKITPNDVIITYHNLSSNERAIKVYKNSAGTYEYVFPLIKINKNATNNVYVEFSPQDIGGDTKVYTLQFLLRQYNSAKQVISDLTLLSQSDYNGFNTRTYGSYTAYYRSLAVPTLDTNTEYVQLILRFTTSTAPYYNHIIQVYLDSNVNQRLCHNYAIFTSMTANTIYTIEDNVRSILDKEIIIQYNNQLYSNTFYVNNKTSYSSASGIESTFSNKIKGVFDEFSTRLVGNTDMSIALFLAFMSIMFFSTVITRNIAVMYAIFILIVSITAYIYSTEILSMPALIILAFMAIALAIYYRYR